MQHLKENKKIILKSKIFEFITDKEIRQVCYNHFSYAFYLYLECIEEDFNDLDLLEYKSHSICLYLWSIVESIVAYFVWEIYKENPKKLEKYLQNKEFKVESIVKLRWEELFLCSKKEKKIKYSDNINFNQIIHWIRSWKLLSQEMIDWIDTVRNIRNTIHINLYKKKVAEFTEAKVILWLTIDIIKEISQKLNKKN